MSDLDPAPTQGSHDWNFLTRHACSSLIAPGTAAPVLASPSNFSQVSHISQGIHLLIQHSLPVVLNNMVCRSTISSPSAHTLQTLGENTR